MTRIDAPVEALPGAGVFIVGCGDIGRRVARLEQAAGHRVLALARSETAASVLWAQGIEAIPGDLDHPASLHRLPPRAAVLYYFAPPPAEGSGDPRLASLLTALTPAALPGRIVYISTSAVYGDCQGAWIREDQPVAPKTDRARRRVAAEQTLRDWSQAYGVPWVVLRVPGIYGPGRWPLAWIRQGRPVPREAECPYSNRIHADDLAAACFAAARRGRPGQVYHASDGHPTTLTDYLYRVADAFDLPRPPAVALTEFWRTASPTLRSYLEDSKRLDNRRLLQDLGLVLRYPDLASGLAAARTAAPG